MSYYEYYEDDEHASGGVSEGGRALMGKIFKCSENPSDPECQEMQSGVEPALTTENYQDYYPYRLGRKKMSYDGYENQCKCSRWNWLFFLLLIVIIVMMLVSLYKKNKK